MLGLLFRGVFLIGILTWYSTSVWKMIDGYFRDQFRSYLEEEYRKNPRMKSDVQGNPVDTVDSVVTTPRPPETVEPVVTTPRPQETVEPPRETLETVESGAVEAAECNSTESNEESEVTGGTSENEDTGGSDKNAFQGTSVESGLESRKSTDRQQDSQQPISHDDRDLGQRQTDRHRSPSRRRIDYYDRLRRRSVTPRDISREQRRNVKTITLTDKDFKSAAKKQDSDDDFWEFEEDADEREPAVGILVSQLPFKPRADIGDLERVTEDEYCPLTLEDESCDETFRWA